MLINLSFQEAKDSVSSSDNSVISLSPEKERVVLPTKWQFELPRDARPQGHMRLREQRQAVFPLSFDPLPYSLKLRVKCLSSV